MEIFLLCAISWFHGDEYQEHRVTQGSRVADVSEVRIASIILFITSIHGKQFSTAVYQLQKCVLS
jgi:hypothetical protein